MSFRKCFSVGALLVFAALTISSAAPARAQGAIYGVVTGERVSGFTCQDPQNNCANNNGKEEPYGGTFGVYYDFRSIGPVRLGADFRGSVLNAAKSAEYYGTSPDQIRHYSALGGLRGSIGTPIKILHPYAEVAGGYARYIGTLVPTANYTQVQGLVGVDVNLLPWLDLRAIEFGAGAIFGPANHSTQSIGAGLVLHLPR
jgi:hypothetical protein